MRMRTVLRGLGNVPGGGMVVGAVLALGALAWLFHKRKLSPAEAQAAADTVVAQAAAVANAAATAASGAADALATESAAQSVATHAVETANKVSEDAVAAVADANKAEQEAKKASTSGSPMTPAQAAQILAKKRLAIFKVQQAQKSQQAVGKLATHMTALRRLSTGESVSRHGVAPGVDKSAVFTHHCYPGGGVLGLRN